jgi:hypothetical protein
MAPCASGKKMYQYGIVTPLNFIGGSCGNYCSVSQQGHPLYDAEYFRYFVGYDDTGKPEMLMS